VAIWAQPPQRRVVFYKSKHYFISLPVVLYRIRYVKKKDGLKLADLAVGFVAEENIDKDTNIYFPSLPNVDGDDNDSPESLVVCMKGGKKCETLDALVKQTIHTFWASKFNNQMEGGDGYARYDEDADYDDWGWDYDASPEVFKKWQKKTKQDPNWIPGIKDMKRWGKYKQFTKTEYLGKRSILPHRRQGTTSHRA
jgi:hypothetical protein